MKTILCFGDSNTWGQIPLRAFVKSRYPREVRWPGQLEMLGAPHLRVLEEGNNGRTTGPEDPLRTGRSALTYLPACLDSAVPVDLVILMLGSNDLKFKFNPNPQLIAARMGELVKIVKTIGAAPPNQGVEILVISPPLLKPEHYMHGDYDYPEALAYSKALPAAYEAMCKNEGVQFLDASLFAEVSNEDGSHLDPENHRLLAEAVYKKVPIRW